MRLFWLDNLKAAGVFFVALGHILPESYLKQYIYSFHVPLFFFISGYLFDRSKYTFMPFVKRKCTTLLVPYLFFAALSFVFWLVVVRPLSISGRSLAVSPLKPLVGIVYGVGAEGWQVPLNVALWFLPCLFIVELLFYAVHHKVFLIIFAVLGSAAAYLPVRLPWSADAALPALVFYGIGYFYKDRWASPKSFPLWVALHLLFCFLNSPVDMNTLSYGQTIFFYAAGCSGIFTWLILAKAAGRTAMAAYIGRNAIVFVGLVGTMWYIIRGVIYIACGLKFDEVGPLYALIASALQIVLTLPAIAVISRWFPFVLGRGKESHMHADR